MLILITLVFCNCKNTIDNNLYGKYEVFEIVDGIIDTNNRQVWQFDSLYYSNITHIEDNFTQTFSYRTFNDTIFLFNAFKLKNSNKIRLDTISDREYFIAKLNNNGLITLKSGWNLNYSLKRIGNPISVYNDTTEIKNHKFIKDKLNGSWSFYSNVLEDKYNEEFMFYRYEFKGDECIVTTKITEANPFKSSYRVYVVKNDEFVLIPMNEYFWNNGASTRGNMLYSEKRLKIIELDSTKLKLAFLSSNNGISMIFEKDSIE